MRDLFNSDFPEIHIDKPIRLIELFGGYGSQSMALKRIGADFEPYFLCEFDEPAVRSYNAVHGTNFKPSDIRDVHGEDLKICETDKYFYMLTYSFPCTDLSVAGKMAGMAKGSGTRSGLLWEVERILMELNESDAELPQCLFMENVPQVTSEQNSGDFNSWRAFLQRLGYTSYLEILNAKDYGVAQNRERAFMFSFLGDVYYEFPKPIPLEKRLVDYLEEDVDEKYYLKSEKAKRLIDDLIERGELNCEGGGTGFALTEQSVTQDGAKSRTASRRGTTVESRTCARTERSSSRTLIPCKMNGVSNGNFLQISERTVRDVGCEFASTIPARYYKGATGNGDNMVIEMNGGYEYEKDANARRGGQERRHAQQVSSGGGSDAERCGMRGGLCDYRRERGACVCPQRDNGDRGDYERRHNL